MEEMHHDNYAKRSVGSQSSHDVLICNNQKWSISHWLNGAAKRRGRGEGLLPSYVPAGCVSIFAPSRYVMGLQFWPFTLIWG